MAQDLHITFKAGICEAGEKDSSDGAPRHIKPLPEAGYIYLLTEDDLLHFCWRPRAAPMSEPKLDLIMFAGDASFEPYQQHGSNYGKTSAGQTQNGRRAAAPTNGRLYVLSFSSSSDRHFFWLQSKSQSPSGDPAWHSPRDLKIAEIVNKLLQGDEVDVRQELAAVSHDSGGGGGDDNDTAMEDGDGGASPSHHRAASGGAGADATGGDIREEGEEAREGGADGGRAATATAPSDAQAAIASFLQSLQGTNFAGSSAGAAGGGGGGGGGGKLFTTLPDLLPAATTLPILADLPGPALDRLLAHLPPTLVPEGAAESAKRDLLAKVLRSPQFQQSLMSLTSALRDGGLPSVGEALAVPLRNGGFVNRAAGVPLGGGDAVEAFVRGVREKVEAEKTEGAEEKPAEQAE